MEDTAAKDRKRFCYDKLAICCLKPYASLPFFKSVYGIKDSMQNSSATLTTQHSRPAFYLQKFKAAWKCEPMFFFFDPQTLYVDPSKSKTKWPFLEAVGRSAWSCWGSFVDALKAQKVAAGALLCSHYTTLSSSKNYFPLREVLSALSYNIEALTIWLSIIVKTMYAGSDGIRVQLYAISFTSHSALISL